MPVRTSRERLAQAAFWYYIQDLGQEEVARRLGVSRSSVSRLLRAAREQEVIRFEVVYPMQRDLRAEADLLHRFAAFGLREVVVAATPPDDAQRGVGGQPGALSAAEAAAEWLAANVRDGQTLGLFWGSAVRTMVDVARFSRKLDVHVVQLAGEWSNDPRRSGHDLVRDLAAKLGGSYTYFNAPAFVATATDADALLAEPQVAASLALARSTDLCVVGIGRFLADTTEMFLQQANATPEEVAEARGKGVVGQLAGRFFDSSGRQVDLAIHRRLVSLELEELRAATTLLAIASGAAKRQAVEGALLGGLVDVLACDSELATALMAPSGTD